jgi:hypothetical protein
VNKIRRRSIQVVDRRAARRLERRACDAEVARGLVEAGYSTAVVEAWVFGYYSRIRQEALRVYGELARRGR